MVEDSSQWCETLRSPVKSRYTACIDRRRGEWEKVQSDFQQHTAESCNARNSIVFFPAQSCYYIAVTCLPHSAVGYRITSRSSRTSFQESCAQLLKAGRVVAAAAVWTTPSSLREPGSNWQHVGELQRDLCTFFLTQREELKRKEKVLTGSRVTLWP